MKFIVIFALCIAAAIAFPIQDVGDEETFLQNIQELDNLLDDKNIEIDIENPVIQYSFWKKIKKIGKEITKGAKKVVKETKRIKDQVDKVAKVVVDVATAIGVGKGIVTVAGGAAPEQLE